MFAKQIDRQKNAASTGFPALGSDVDPTTLTGAAATAYLKLDNVFQARLLAGAGVPRLVLGATYTGAGTLLVFSLTFAVYDDTSRRWFAVPGATVIVTAGEVGYADVPFALAVSGVSSVVVAVLLSDAGQPDGVFSVGVGTSLRAAESDTLIHQLVLTTPEIIALGAITTKSVQVPVPAGYRLFMVRSQVSGLFAFVDDLSNMAKLQVSADLDGDPLLVTVPIDANFGTNGDKGELVPEEWLGRDMNPSIAANAGFTLRSFDTTDESPGPTFDTLDPLVDANVAIEIHFLRTTVKEISL